MDIQAEKEQVFTVLKGWIFDRSQHGSLFDRGSADSYYHRGPVPHYGGVGGNSGPRVQVDIPGMVEEYMAGYEYNEKYGDKKVWD